MTSLPLELGFDFSGVDSNIPNASSRYHIAMTQGKIEVATVVNPVRLHAVANPVRTTLFEERDSGQIDFTGKGMIYHIVEKYHEHFRNVMISII
ncbi:hypothetical protein MAR_037894 [Mya arenaria]|uniref:Uncharacterized protein n=1 Tax=Mya arenaria TaxID=6604 RepID=A0ABY7FQC0_MYAAR|nr:hypothetical protein MAR_037894 [Mya arenaria]